MSASSASASDLCIGTYFTNKEKIRRELGFARAQSKTRALTPRRHTSRVSHRARRAQRSRGRRSKHLQNARPDDDEDEKSQHDGPDGEILLLRHPRVHRTATVNVSVKLTRLVRHHAMRGSLDANERATIARQSSNVTLEPRVDDAMRRDLRAVASTPRRARVRLARERVRERARAVASRAPWFVRGTATGRAREKVSSIRPGASLVFG